MFTGIVTDIGEVRSIRPRGESLQQVTIACGYDRASIADGASIACAGICLTVVEAGVADGRTWFAADLGAETLAVTTAGRWQRGTKINLERSLRYGDEMGGHLVAGHADGIAELLAREDLTESARLRFRAPAALSRFIAQKGSVALDGVSLTVNDVSGAEFSVLIIPHTLKVTTLGAAQAGDLLNIEIDTMARYVARLAEAR